MIRSLGCVSLAALISFASFVVGANESSIKRDTRQFYTGIIHHMAPSGVGMWQVGSRTFEVGPLTQIYAYMVDVSVGNCAIVYLRGTQAEQIVVRRPGEC